jgi:quinoprotein glucose dehydrogenase
MRSAVLLALAGLFLSPATRLPLALHAAELADPANMFKGVAPASDEGERALRSFTVPEGLQVELVAAEPLLANGVAFSIDEQGRFYVVETFRHGAGILDIRGRRGWPKEAYREDLPRERMRDLADEVLDMDLAVETVDDRVAYLKNYFDHNAESLAGTSDRIRFIWDSDGDGKPDKSSVFADGFARPEDGLASGVISRRGEVWFTNIPDLWWLRDNDGDGVADQRRSLGHGFGIRSGFLGHDMHGLVFGPDGKLYFTIGDRAANVSVAGGGALHVQDSGAVFRCNPDGTEMEVFATGLRNPQELTFDHHGNLFTGDNNSDGGDQARWVHLVEGGDSGWRIGYQFQEGSDAIYSQQARGPWNAEKMWHTQNDEQPAFLVPPVAILGNGPSGVSYYPGTGLSERWNGQFFMVDFRGQANNSGVHSFALNPKGAGFELVNPERFIWSVLATDIDFGVDGGLYVLDWVQGWGVTGKGRIYRVFDPGLQGDPAIAETKKLLREGMANRSPRELGRLLASQDYRVRLDAQFELVRRGEDGLRELTRAVRQTRDHAARLHGVWGLGQVLSQFRGQVTTFRARRDTVATLVALLDDASEQVRAQSAKVLGEARAGESLAGLIKLAADSDATVRFHAVMGLGKLNQLSALPAILTVLRENNDADPLLRHAGVMALTTFRDRDTLNTLAKDASPAVRMASLLAMRRLKYDDIGQFLNDAEPGIVREAARAINDAPVNGATLALAAHEPRDWNDAVILGRWVNANLRAGNASHARKLAAVGANPQLPEPVRRDALLALGDWGNPSGRDRVTGNWRPLLVSSRDGVVPANALRPHVAGLFSDPSQRVQLAAIEAVARLEITEASSALVELVRNADAAEAVRVAALNALETLNSGELAAALEAATASGQQRLAGAASAIRARTGLGDALAQIQADLKSGSIPARQSAIRSLADLKSAAADEVLLGLLKDLQAEQLPAALGVDVLDVAATREQEVFTGLVKAIETGDGSPLAPYRFTLAGGDAEAGRKIFFEREDVACLRCHQSGLEAGGEVGPKLDGLASRVTPEYILESIVNPNAHIAAGFENIMVETKTGTWVAGLIKSEDNENLVINSPEDGLVTIPVADVKTRQRGASGMPDGMGQILSRQNLRDLLAYLSTLK